MTEAERRQSLFPGKKVEKWDIPLPEKTVQQQVGHNFQFIQFVFRSVLGEHSLSETWKNI